MAPRDPDECDCVVDQDGDGDYESVQAAIDGTKSFPPDRVTIFVREGTYEEKVRVHSWNPEITLVGESPADTVITHDDHFGEIGRGRNSTFFTHTLKVCGNDFRARDLTVRNTAGPDKGQAIALHVEADRAAFENCRFEGDQDTVYLDAESRQYFADCYVEGTTDFVFGGATAYFEDCEIHSKADSYVTAASTPEDEPFGYVFRDCTLTAASEVSAVYLGRPWRKHAHVAFLETELGAHVRPEGWHNWGAESREPTTTYVEYDNDGPGAAAADERVSWSRQLTASEAAAYTRENVLGGDGDDGGESGRHWYQFAGE